jgi:cbb3-type cytochrome oxidase subunit 1
MCMDEESTIYTRLLIGASSFALLALIAEPEEFFDFLGLSIFGIFLSMTVLIPLERSIEYRRLMIREVVCFVAGVILFILLYVFVVQDIVEMVIYILEWFIIYTFVSTVVGYIVLKLSEVLP